MYSESDSKVVAEVDEEEKIYQFIYGMYTTRDREVEESLNTQPPPSNSDHPYNMCVMTLGVPPGYAVKYFDMMLIKSATSSEDSPVYVKNNTERRFHTAVNTTKGPGMDALDDIQEMPVEKVKSTEEKPWRESGADISDYFNYGFDEASWKTYCKKQTSLCAANAKLRIREQTQTEDEMLCFTEVQKGQSKHGGNELCWANALSCWPSSPASRYQNAQELLCVSKLREWSPGVRHRSSRMGRQRLGDKGDNTQAIAEMSFIEHRSTSSSLRFLTYVPSPSFLYQRRPRPRSSLSTLDSEQAEESTNLPSSASSVAWTVTSSAAVTNTVKRRRSSREHGHNQASKRDREGQVWSGSSPSSRDKQTRRRETRKPGHRHGFKERRRGDSRGKEQKSRGWHTPRSSSRSRSKIKSRRGDGEDKSEQTRSRNTKRRGKGQRESS